MRLGWPVRPLVDTKQPLDRGSRPALLLRIELSHPVLDRRLLRLRFVRARASAALGNLLSAPSASLGWTTALTRRLPGLTPRFVDSGHFHSYHLLQM